MSDRLEGRHVRGLFGGTRVRAVRVKFQDADYIPHLQLHRHPAPSLQPLLNDRLRNAIVLFSRAESLASDRESSVITLTHMLKLLNSPLDH